MQQIVIRPSEEWVPPAQGWTLVRVAESVGYWIHHSQAREFKPGDGFATSAGSGFVLRASQLGPLKLDYFCVHPQFLSGLITVSEGHQLEQAMKNSAAQVIPFGATEVVGQKFSRLVAQPQRESLAMRSALLQLWSQAVAGVLNLPPAPDHARKLRERFHQLIAQMPDAKLAAHSLTELAGQLQCSERHFSRMFRKEFGVAFRVRQTELRLQRACELLANSKAKITMPALPATFR